MLRNVFIILRNTCVEWGMRYHIFEIEKITYRKIISKNESKSIRDKIDNVI